MASPMRADDSAPRALLARANTRLPDSVHALLASTDQWQVRYRWASRGDIPIEILVQAALQETSESVKLLLETHPGFPADARSSRGAWADAAAALDRTTDEHTANLALASLELVHPMHRPWSAPMALLAATVGDLPRYPRILKLVLSGCLTADSVRGVPATESIVSCLLHAARGKDHLLALVGYLQFQPAAVGYLGEHLHAAPEWGSDLLEAITSPTSAWRKVAAARHQPARLPSVLALRAVCESSTSPEVTVLLGHALQDEAAHRLLAAPLLHNRHLGLHERAKLLAGSPGLLPHACSVRGPVEDPQLAVPEAVAGVRVSAARHLLDSSVGTLLVETALAPAVWHVLETLWPTWEGTLIDLICVSKSLAQ